MEPLHRHKLEAYSAYVGGCEIFNVSSNGQMNGDHVRCINVLHLSFLSESEIVWKYHQKKLSQ